MRPLLAIVTCSMLCIAAEPPEPKPTVSCDPVATADWLISVFIVRDGKVLVASKESDKYLEARLRFPKPVEIQTHGRQIIADQEGLYPLIIGPMDSGYEFHIYTPFYVFMDDITESDGLPGYAPHPKAEAINEKGFRKIAEKLHSHFTKCVGSRPECFRVRDDIGYPSEHYVWTVGTTFIILTAYDGNDSNGIYLNITTSTKAIDRVRKMPRTSEDVFESWGYPMPSISTTQPK
jgi:hypothetical protein